MYKFLTLTVLAACVSTQSHAQLGNPGALLNQDAVRATSCIGDRVMFDDACRSESWIESNLTDGVEVEQFGPCEQAEVCDLYYTTITSSSSSGDRLRQTSEVVMLKDEACDGGSGCINGHQMAFKTVSEFTIDNGDREATGRFDMYLGKYKRRIGSTRVDAEHRGYSLLEVTTSRRTVGHYDSDGVYLGGEQADLELFSASDRETFCEHFVDYLGNDFIIGSISTAVGGYAAFLISSNSTTLSIGAGLIDPVILAPSIYVGGQALALATLGVVSAGTYALLKTLADKVNAAQLCDDIDLLDNTFDDDIGEGFDDDDIEEEGVYMGCRECTAWEDTDEGLQVSVDTDEGIDIIFYDLSGRVCTEWTIDIYGLDTNGDGWCD
ncbi:MAG: hypothetical protein ACE366_03245 [Bradymonadia bacterium]